MNLIDLSFSAVLALACMATIGCQPQQTHNVRSTRLPDGTQYTYSNDSSGYGYNPNFTSNQNVDVAAPSAAANVNVNAGEGGGSWGFGSMGATPYGNSYGYPYGYGNAGAYYGGYYGDYYGGSRCNVEYDPFTKQPIYRDAGPRRYGQSDVH